MTEKVITAPAEETTTTKPQVEEKNDTIGAVLETKDKTVPESAFLEQKKARKEAEKRVKELEAMVKEGATPSEISDDIDAIGEEFGVDKNFLKKLTQSIEKKAEEKLKPIAEREQQQRIDTIFNKSFAETLETMPEYKDIVNKDVIKTLSLDKANQSKTFAKLIEETYGNALQGKHTIETTTPRGGKTLEEIDFMRAKRDVGYFNEIMASPEAKKKYNAGLAQSLNL